MLCVVVVIFNGRSIGQETPSPEVEVQRDSAANSRDATAPRDADDDRAVAKSPLSGHTLSYWVAQLQHDDFLRRETASKRLGEAGSEVVPLLTDAIRGGDLETTSRAVRVLSDLALNQDASDTDGAWGALNRLVDTSAGSRKATAMTAIRGVRDARERVALVALQSAGVFIGDGDFAVGPLTSLKYSLRIDERWNGDVKALQWLRWVRRIQYVSAHGIGVCDEALMEIALMPNVRTIVLVDGTLTAAGIAALGKRSRIDSLELRYVKLTPQMTDLVAKLPIFNSLNLMGTGVNTARAQQLQQELPGLNVLNRKGGFLGVRSGAVGGRCEISTVTRGSGAEKAGLRARDVVTEIDGEEIREFADLQRVIGQHSAGDRLNFIVDRHGESIETTVQLGRQLE
jgi:hypothetical protein